MYTRWLAVSFVCLAVSAQQKPPDFQREIRPILSDNCFQCHGPDSKSRMAGVRLDRKDDALKVKDRLLARVAAPDPARRMPPAYSNKKLTDAQVSTMKRWIEAGAPWQEHWAFQAPVKPAGNLDSLVLAKLKANGLTPAVQADART